jgi:hypothetical protein
LQPEDHPARDESHPRCQRKHHSHPRGTLVATPGTICNRGPTHEIFNISGVRETGQAGEWEAIMDRVVQPGAWQTVRRPRERVTTIPLQSPG